MVRGCQKKIVYLKNTGSEVFDEAYFVVRDNALADLSECDMVKEANKILDECISLEEEVGFFEVLKDFIKRRVISFAIGIALGIVIALLIK